MRTVDAAIESRALAAVKVLSSLGMVRAACLFGSHVEGTPDEWSDIDVAVFMEGGTLGYPRTGDGEGPGHGEGGQ
jgi:predicted nucleotidyltransferase